MDVVSFFDSNWSLLFLLPVLEVRSSPRRSLFLKNVEGEGTLVRFFSFRFSLITIPDGLFYVLWVNLNLKLLFIVYENHIHTFIML